MTGYVHETKRCHCCTESVDLEKVVPIGLVRLAEDGLDDTAIAKVFETIALRLLAPGRNENFLAPVNDVSWL
jgi:hypothetical protein